MTPISHEMSSYRWRKVRRSLLTFLKFCWIFVFFWFFWKFPKYWKLVIGWDTALLKLKICHLQGEWEPNTANNSLMWPPYHTKWHHIDGERSGDHFWHFWNFAELLCFSDFFGNFQNIKTRYWPRYSYFKVEDMPFIKQFRT